MKTFAARLAGLALGLGAAAPGAAATIDGFTCLFGTECVGTSRPCDEESVNRVEVTREGEVWTMHSADGTAIPFSQVGAEDGAVFTLLSTRGDPGAAAVMLMSITPNGRALLSTHGVFRDLKAVLHTGICRPEVN